MNWCVSLTGDRLQTVEPLQCWENTLTLIDTQRLHRSDCTTCFDGKSDINLSSPVHPNKAEEWRSHCFHLVHYTEGSWASSENCVSTVVYSRQERQPAAETEILSPSADIRRCLRIFKGGYVADYKLDNGEGWNSQMSAEICAVTSAYLCEKDRKHHWHTHAHNSVGISKECLTVDTGQFHFQPVDGEHSLKMKALKLHRTSCSHDTFQTTQYLKQHILSA